MSFPYMCFVCGLWSLRHGRRVVGDGGRVPHFSTWWGRPPILFACKRPDFKPILNRLLPKCVCLWGSAPGLAGGGAFSTPRPPAGKVWVTHRSFGQLTPKMTPHMCQPSRNRAGNPAFWLISRIPAFWRKRTAFLALFRNNKNR